MAHSVYLKSDKRKNKSGVIDSIYGKGTKILLAHYELTKGGMALPYDRGENIVGYCTDSPEDVLTKTFEFFQVVFFNGQLTYSGEHELDRPKIGLEITPYFIPNVYGLKCNGRLEEFLGFEGLLKARRDTPVSKGYLQAVIDRLESPNCGETPNCPRDQRRYNQDQIVKILENADYEFLRNEEV